MSASLRSRRFCGNPRFGSRLRQAKVAGSPGTPPQITLSYGESTNRTTTTEYDYDLNRNRAVTLAGE